MNKSRALSRLSKIAIILIIPIILFSSLFAFNIIPLQVVGYEGAKMYIRGINVPLKFGLWTDDMPKPSSASTFAVDYGNLEINPDSATEGWQSLLFSTQTNGQMERTIFGDRVDTISWDITIWDNGTARQVKHIQASVYYFDFDQTYRSKVHDDIYNVLTNEKYNPWQQFTLWFEVSGDVWKVEGNDSSFVAVLGVEPVSVQLQQGKNWYFAEGYQYGQMLPMYESIAGSQITPITPEMAKGSDISPDPRLRSSVFVPVPITECGVKCNSYFDQYSIGEAHVMLRAHILKVDKWLAIQKYGGTYTTPNVPNGGWDALANFFSNPFNILLSGIGLMIVVFVLLMIVAPASMMALIMLMLGRRRRGLTRISFPTRTMKAGGKVYMVLVVMLLPLFTLVYILASQTSLGDYTYWYIGFMVLYFVLMLYWLGRTGRKMGVR